MRMNINWHLALAAVVLTASQAVATTVPIPSAYWNFDNEDGQSMGTYDGFVQPSAATNLITPSPNLKLIVAQFNGLAGNNGSTFFQAGSGSAFNGAGSYNQGGTYPMNYRNHGGISAPFTANNTNYRGMYDGGGNPLPSSINAATPARENYIVSGATFTNPGNAYRLVGGIHNNYDPTSDGNPILNPQTDALATGGPVGTSGPQTPTGNDIFSYQDRLRPDPGTGAGNGQNALLNSVSNQLTYSFWLNVFGATNSVDSTRFGTGASYIIGRSSSGNAGSVAIRFKDNPGTPRYTLNLFGSNRQTGADATNLYFDQGSWHHFVVQFDMSNGDVDSDTVADNGAFTLWMDGGPLAGGQKQLFTNMGLAAINGIFRLNNAPSGSQRESGDFALDELAVWQGLSLTDAQVLQIYQNGIVESVPEPSSLALCGFGLASLFAFGRRHGRKQSA